MGNFHFLKKDLIMSTVNPNEAPEGYFAAPAQNLSCQGCAFKRPSCKASATALGLAEKLASLCGKAFCSCDTRKDRQNVIFVTKGC
jgi:hypothetical protein